eukprot:m.165901 g.165901  ORF g.165901 m.165901 type:complete len:111 (+) comp14693_c0_seq2:1919-2251(+)
MDLRLPPEDTVSVTPVQTSPRGVCGTSGSSAAFPTGLTLTTVSPSLRTKRGGVRLRSTAEWVRSGSFSLVPSVNPATNAKPSGERDPAAAMESQNLSWTLLQTSGSLFQE